MQLLRECFSVNLRHIFRGSFCKNTSGKLLLLVTPNQPTNGLIANESNFPHHSQPFSNFYGGILIRPKQPKAEILKFDLIIRYLCTLYTCSIEENIAEKNNN